MMRAVRCDDIINLLVFMRYLHVFLLLMSEVEIGNGFYQPNARILKFFSLVI